MTGAELKAYRQKAGLTQTQLAELSGIGLRAVQKYEAGDNDIGRIEVTTAARMAHALGLHTSDFSDKSAFLCGSWGPDKMIDLVNIGGKIYSLYGWNGESYVDCWLCLDRFTPAPDDRKYTIRPVYRFERDDIDISALEENSPEWDRAVEIVDYNLS